MDKGHDILDQTDKTVDLWYKVGKKVGRREVVEWINKHTIGITADNNLMDNPCWIALLKEWGIGE